MDKHRFLSHKFYRLMDMFPVVALTGVRQCGKSTLVRSLFPDWQYYDLERPDHYQLISDDPQGFFTYRPNNVIIDEAQEYPKIFSVLRGVIDSDRTASGRYILTGSSSPDIVKGLSETLAGRMATLELWPFKASEYYEYEFPEVYQMLLTSSDIRDLTKLNSRLTLPELYSHWLEGGYPEPRIREKAIKGFHDIWMEQYFADYVRRDIQRLFPGINTHRYRLFVQALSRRSGTYINASEIARALETSSVTAADYLEIIHGTFVWRNLRSYEGNPLKSVQKMVRGLIRDSGLLHYMLKIPTIDDLLVHPQSGQSFESFMTEEIIRGFQCLMQTGLDFFYYRTRDGSEIDLIIKSPFGVIPLEIKRGRNVDRRTLTSMKRFLKDTGARYGVLVNTADSIEIIDSSVIQIPAVFF